MAWWPRSVPEVGEWVTPSPPLLTSPAVVDLIDPSSPLRKRPHGRSGLGTDSRRAGGEAHRRLAARRDLCRPASSRVAPYVIDIEAQNRTVEVEVEAQRPGATPAESVARNLGRCRGGARGAGERVLRLPTSALLEGDRVLVLDGRHPGGALRGARPAQLALRRTAAAASSEDETVVISLDRVGVEAGEARESSKQEDADAESMIRVEDRLAHLHDRGTRSCTRCARSARRSPTESTSPSWALRARARARCSTSSAVSTAPRAVAISSTDARWRASTPTSSLSVRLNRIGFIFQSFHLVPRLSALENVELPMLVRGHPARRAPQARRGRARRGGALALGRSSAERTVGWPEAAGRDLSRHHHGAGPCCSPTSPPATSTHGPAAQY